MNLVLLQITNLLCFKAPKVSFLTNNNTQEKLLERAEVCTLFFKNIMQSSFLKD